MGSKARFAKGILSIVLKDRNGRDYVEPFAGGMNSICEVPANQGKRYANDSNEYLIAMWKALQDGWIPPESVTRDFYYECKAGNCEDYMKGYVGFNCSYSGRFFEGYAGVTKTKAGIRDYQAEAFKNVMKQVPKLKDVGFTTGCYTALQFKDDSIIYCDPPYSSTKKYRDSIDHDKFWQWVRMLSKNNAVYVSEYSAPDDFSCIWEKVTSSSLGANGVTGGNKTSTEKLFVYQP